MVEGSDCKCMSPPFDYRDSTPLPEWNKLNTCVEDGEVGVSRCNFCGANWVRHYSESSFTGSGRWCQAPATDDELAKLSSTEGVLNFIESRPWYFAGGSALRSAGKLVENPAQ